MTTATRTGGPPQVHADHRTAALAESLGLLKRRTKRGRRGGPTCEDCFFHRHMLCALDLEGPCSTFRPDNPQGLVPPVQPALLPRQATSV